MKIDDIHRKKILKTLTDYTKNEDIQQFKDDYDPKTYKNLTSLVTNIVGSIISSYDDVHQQININGNVLTEIAKLGKGGQRASSWKMGIYATLFDMGTRERTLTELFSEDIKKLKQK